MSVVTTSSRTLVDDGEVQQEFSNAIREFETQWNQDVAVAMASVQVDESPWAVLQRVGSKCPIRRPEEERLWCPGDYLFRNCSTAFCLATNASTYVVQVGRARWQVLDNEVTDLERSRVKANKKRPLKLSPAVLAQVVARSVEDVEVIFIAEGQLARLAVQASSQMMRLALFEIWLCVVDQVVEPVHMQEVICLHGAFAREALFRKEQYMSVYQGVGSDSPEEKQKIQHEMMCGAIVEVRKHIEEYCYELREEHRDGIPNNMFV